MFYKDNQDAVFCETAARAGDVGVTRVTGNTYDVNLVDTIAIFRIEVKSKQELIDKMQLGCCNFNVVYHVKVEEL